MVYNKGRAKDMKLKHSTASMANKDTLLEYPPNLLQHVDRELIHLPNGEYDPLTYSFAAGKSYESVTKLAI